ncbi:MAG: sigma-54-dependent Fis family transcriptional regulator, partial [Candidatus Binatia bacterium]
TREEQERRRRASEELLVAAEPILKGLFKAISPFEMAILLTDAECFVLRAISEGPIGEVLRAANLKEGESVAEPCVGTTSAGVVAHTGRAIQLSGEEHYCRICHGVTCAAAPVFGPADEMVGIVNITASCRAFENYPYALGMAVAAAEAIGQNLRLMTESRKVSLSDGFLTYAINQIPQGLILLDGELRIRHINQEARRILGDAAGLEGDFLQVLRRVRCFDEKSLERLEAICLGDAPVTNEEVILNGREPRQILFLSVTPIRLENAATPGRVIEIRRSREYVRMFNRLTKAEAHFTFADILGDSLAIRRVKGLALRAAEGDCIVLLEGESGTGKEMFAQAIHLESSRAEGPFIAINCAAFPQELIESELFGYEEGAFTGAKRGGRMGKIQLAEGGTLFLDEIGEMSLGVQAKLLRFIEEKKVLRLGGNRYFTVNVRIIAATNQDLWTALKRGSFREDLFYRLNVLNIHVPPLRERTEDVPLLANFFLESLHGSVEKGNGNQVRGITPPAMEYLVHQHWSGNVRELRNWVERALYTVKGPQITLEDCLRISYGRSVDDSEQAARETSDVPSPPPGTPAARLRDLERDAILNALRASRGNVTRAAKMLGISRPTIYDKMRRYGIGERSSFVAT